MGAQAQESACGASEAANWKSATPGGGKGGRTYDFALFSHVPHTSRDTGPALAFWLTWADLLGFIACYEVMWIQVEKLLMAHLGGPEWTFWVAHARPALFRLS